MSEFKLYDYTDNYSNFEDGELEFMSKEVVLEFIKNRMNNSLVSVGYDKLFDTNAELVREHLV